MLDDWRGAHLLIVPRAPSREKPKEPQESTFVRSVRMFNEGMEPREISAEIGISDVRVYQHLRRAGLKPRSNRGRPRNG